MKKTFSEIISMFRGLLIVLKHAFKRPVTIRYPEERRKLPPRSRGRHFLTKWEDGKERCVGCELCAIVCPSQAIYVKAATNEPGKEVSRGERHAKDYQINMLRCIFCGLCEEACPTGAVVLGTDYELSGTNRESLIYTKEMLTEKNPGDSGRDPKREI
ncbi:NADH-quinone oxidoreductase subunit NuoI [Estrella lausannensis]|nr:NADH-quinone oxidoreductase subunit NuoI [Estrella lausannensis]